jgi:Putative peptidoglycan binding domain
MRARGGGVRDEHASGSVRCFSLADAGRPRRDGVIGSGTIDAVRKFQADHGLTTTGKIEPQLLNALGIDYKAQSSVITRQKIVT